MAQQLPGAQRCDAALQKLRSEIDVSQSPACLQAPIASAFKR